MALLPQVPSLAPQIYPGNRVKAPITCEPVVHFPEWTTGSFDLAGNQGKGTISYELVVHFLEWTTGSFDLAGNRVESPITCELVAHFPEWTTSSSDLAGKGGGSPISYELVAHFPEWTTGSADLAGNRGSAVFCQRYADLSQLCIKKKALDILCVGRYTREERSFLSCKRSRDMACYDVQSPPTSLTRIYP